MIETHPAPESKLVPASYAHLAPAPQPGVEYTLQAAFTDQPTFWNRAEPDASDLVHDVEAAATWWPAILVVLVAALAGLALFGVL